jgi:hypothetical protein
MDGGYWFSRSPLDLNPYAVALGIWIQEVIEIGRPAIYDAMIPFWIFGKRLGAVENGYAEFESEGDMARRPVGDINVTSFRVCVNIGLDEWRTDGGRLGGDCGHFRDFSVFLGVV